MTRLRIPTLLGGVAMILFGIWFLLDASGAVHVSFAALGPVLAAVAGLVLLARGLEDRE
ncbi:MAG: hypothetical protein QOC54_1918 [Baekduia sp.]|nr:hypothetical protein [Baekduia sp.]